MPRIKSALRGALRGLDPHRDIIIDDTADTIEIGSGDENDKKTTKRSTRTRRHSGSHVVNYDQKYHPMDAVTRPNSRVTRRHVPDSSQTLDLSSDDDSDSSLSSAIDVDSEEEDDSEDELASDPPVYITPRTPNPGAVRQSSRAEARKPVNYSKKYHPQDVGIPGFQHKARHFALVQPTPAPGALSKSKRRRSVSPEEEADGEPRRPRKHLRSLHPTKESPPKAVEPKKRGRGRPRKKPVTPDSDIDEALLLADWACVSTQRRKRTPTPLPEDQASPKNSPADQLRAPIEEKSDDPDDIAMNAIGALRPATQRAARQSKSAEADDPASDSGVDIPGRIAPGAGKTVCPDSDSDNESLTDELNDEKTKSDQTTKIGIDEATNEEDTDDESINGIDVNDESTNDEPANDKNANQEGANDKIAIMAVNHIEANNNEFHTDDVMGFLQYHVEPDDKSPSRPASRESRRTTSRTMSENEEEDVVQEEEGEDEPNLMPSFGRVRSQFEEQMALRPTDDDEAANDDITTVEVNNDADKSAEVSTVDMRDLLRYHVEPDEIGTPRPASRENRRTSSHTISEGVVQQEEEADGERNLLPSFGRVDSEFEEQMAITHPRYPTPVEEVQNEAHGELQGEFREESQQESEEEPEEEPEQEPFEGFYSSSSEL